MATTRKKSLTSKGLPSLHVKVDKMLDKAKPWSSIIGMAPCLYYGTSTEDVNIFIDEAERASRHNQWGTGAEAVVRLAYFLEGNAKHAFDAEVADRTARRKRDEKLLLPSQGSASLPADDDDEKNSEGDINNIIGYSEPKRRRYEAWLKTYENNREKRRELRTKLDNISQSLEELARKERLILEQISEAQVKQEDPLSFQKQLNEIDAGREALQKEYAETKAESDKNERSEEETFRLVDIARREYDDAKSMEKMRLQTAAAGTKEDPVDLSALENDDAALAFPTLNEFFLWLRTVFEREEVIHAYMSEFYGRRQKRGEKVQDFALELMRLSKRSGMDVDEKERTQHFIDGLTRRMKKHMRREWAKKGLRGSDIRQWSEVLEMAKKLERDIPELSEFGGSDDSDVITVNSAMEDDGDSTTTAGEVVMSAQANEKAAHAEILGAIKEMMATMMEQVKGRANACYNCGEQGHLSRDCPKPPSENTQRYRAGNRAGQRARNGPPQKVQCYACGKFGHYANA